MRAGYEAGGATTRSTLVPGRTAVYGDGYVATTVPAGAGDGCSDTRPTRSPFWVSVISALLRLSPITGGTWTNPGLGVSVGRVVVERVGGDVGDGVGIALGGVWVGRGAGGRKVGNRVDVGCGTAVGR